MWPPLAVHFPAQKIGSGESGALHVTGAMGKFTFYIFNSLKKTKKVSFNKTPITFRGPRLSGAYFLRGKVNGQRWPKEIQQTKQALAPLRIPHVGSRIIIFFEKDNYDLIGWTLVDQLQNTINFSIKNR